MGRALALGIAFTLASGCASSDPAPPPTLRGTPTRDAPDDDSAVDGGKADASTSTPPSSKDAGTTTDNDSGPAPKLTTWKGTKAASPTVEFGGGEGYCRYSVTMKNIEGEFVVDDAGNASSGTVHALMEEKTVGSCGLNAMDPSAHSYTLKKTSYDDGILRLEFDRDPNNRPAASLVFAGTFGASSLDGTLTWHRTDIKAPFAWTVQATLTLTPSSP